MLQKQKNKNSKQKNLSNFVNPFVVFFYLPYFNKNSSDDIMKNRCSSTSIAPRAHSVAIHLHVLKPFRFIFFRCSIPDFAVSAIMTFVQNRIAVVLLQWLRIYHSHLNWHVFINACFFFVFLLLFRYATPCSQFCIVAYTYNNKNKEKIASNSLAEWNHEAILKRRKNKTNFTNT